MRHPRSAKLLSLVALVALLAAAGCSSKGGSSGGGSAGGLPATVTVGVPLDLSGSAGIAGVGTHELAGIKLAVQEINDTHYLGNTKISIDQTDTKADKDDSVAAVLKMVTKDDVDAIVGFTLTPSFSAAAPRAQAAGVPIIAVGLAAPDVTKVGDDVFRIIPDVSQVYPPQDKVFAQTFKAKTAAYLYNNDSDTVIPIQQARQKALEAEGVKTVDVETMTQKDTDVRAQLTKIKQANPDIVVLSIFPGQFAMVYQQAHQVGITAQLIAADGTADQQTLSQAGSAMQCTVYTAVWSPLSTAGNNTHFQQYLQQKLGASTQPDLFYAAGYDGMWVYATALKKAGTADKAKVRDALASLKDFKGAMGQYGFDANRDPTITGTNLQIRSSKPVLWKPGDSCQK